MTGSTYRQRTKAGGLLTLGLALLFAALLGAPAANASISPQAMDTWLNPNSGRCMGVAGGNMTNGTNIILWDCVSSAASQHWSHPPANDGYYYEITNSANSNKCLSVQNASLSAAQLVIRDCTGGADQYWKVNSSNGAYVLINYHSGLAVSIGGASTDNGAPIVQYTYHYGPDQYWL